MSRLRIYASLERAQHPDAPDQHSTGVDARGDHAMGFSHENSTHHFRLLSDGGAIEVSAKDPKDTATRDQIRMHLSHIAKMFSEGDIQAPMFIHDTVPPGVPEMQTKRAAITYTFEATLSGPSTGCPLSKNLEGKGRIRHRGFRSAL